MRRMLLFLVNLVVACILGAVAYTFREVLPPWAMGVIVGAPLLGGLLLVLLFPSPAPERPPRGLRAEKEPPPPQEEPHPKETEAPPQEEYASPEAYVAAFLGVLQREGRFLDFLSEDIEAYDDAQIGAAVRSIHRGLKTAVFEMVQLRPVVEAQEGAQVLIEEGFNPKEIRLVGKVKGRPPFKGILRHPGWRFRRLNLPQPRQDDILAPAEVEIP